jgi:hypothetical protein
MAEVSMPRSTRILLIFVAALILFAALLALTYALAPVETQSLRATLQPTLFAPPVP